jgi:hypothetical protein
MAQNKKKTAVFCDRYQKLARLPEGMLIGSKNKIQAQKYR